MGKRNKYLEKALNSLNINYDNSKHEVELNNEKDLDFLITEQKSKKQEALMLIEELKESIEAIESNLQLLTDLKHQIKVEEYKSLNPKAQVF